MSTDLLRYTVDYQRMYPKSLSNQLMPSPSWIETIREVDGSCLRTGILKTTGERLWKAHDRRPVHCLFVLCAASDLWVIAAGTDIRTGGSVAIRHILKTSVSSR